MKIMVAGLKKGVGLIILLSLGLLCTGKAADFDLQKGKNQNGNLADTSKYLKAVHTFADNVLKSGRDIYGKVHSPLFVDGIHINTGEPVRWENGQQPWIISNFGSQQNLMHVLVGLSEITGDEKYRDAAAEAVRYMYDFQTDSAGLLYWGGHQFVDLENMENQFKGRPHELKNNYPFYEFMWEVDSVSTRNMLRAMWNAHILDWSVLDLNRHGEYDLQLNKLWKHEFEQPQPFFEGEGLTFINAGTDMIQAAMALYALGKDEEAKTWGVRLYHQYVRARHPDTGLGVYQYSQPKRTEIPPKTGPLEEELTFSRYGDRAKNQFADKYGDIALEGNVLWGSRMHTLYGKSPVMMLHLAEQLKGSEAGEKLLNWTLSGLKAYVKYAYSPEQNHFKPMWTNGVDLTGQVMPRTGYYGKKGTPFKPVKPTGEMMLALAKAVNLSEGSPELWEVMRSMFKAEKLGELGEDLKTDPELNYQTQISDPGMLVAVLEIHKATKNEKYLCLAEKIGNNILKDKFHEGYFIASEKHKYVRFDIPDPLALLMLEEARSGLDGRVPPYLTGYGSTDGEPGKDGRPSDEEIYDKTF
ncbi:pectate lyase [Gracilimonas sp.]|uniref:pectate lyase n=1 Tax=Gracilimonas sp. TaxID=1974203 RepID=UPI0032EF6D99